MSLLFVCVLSTQPFDSPTNIGTSIRCWVAPPFGLAQGGSSVMRRPGSRAAHGNQKGSRVLPFCEPLQPERRSDAPVKMRKCGRGRNRSSRTFESHRYIRFHRRRAQVLATRAESAFERLATGFLRGAPEQARINACRDLNRFPEISTPSHRCHTAFSRSSERRPPSCPKSDRAQSATRTG